MRPRPLRYAAILLSLLGQPIASPQSQPFAVVSAASYQPVVAPDSLATVFGANLAASAASATLDANGQLPVVLAGTSVSVDGQAASLIYVSPSQINFLIPGATTPGTATVVIQSTVTGGRQTATVQVGNTAPAIFTADASGKGPGSILNAVTYAGAPFLVETPENGAADLRTRLAVYSTGLRYSGNPSHDAATANVAANVQATGQDSNGTIYSFNVEYAGAAPGYFGLDQVNIVLPPELDGAGAVSLLLTTDSGTSNAVTFQMGTLPASAIRLIGLTISPVFVNAGDSATATVSLNAPARSVGLPVSIRGSNPLVQLPLSVTVPAGKASVTFPVATSANVTAVQTVTITAQAGGNALSAELEIDPPSLLQLVALTVTSASVQGGHSASGTVGLSGPAPPGGAVVQVSSDNAVAQPPSAVTIPFNSTSTTFPIATSAVTSTQTANLTGTLGRSSKTAQLTVAPALQLTLTGNSVTGGNSVSGTVTIGDPAPAAGTTINFRSDNPTIAQPPVPVTIPSGQTSAAFTITTISVTVARTVTITASSPNSTQSASVSLTVSPLGSVTLSSLTVSPAQVTGGANATATITLSGTAPAGGTVVNVQSNSPYAMAPQLLVTVPQGLTATAITITTIHPPTPQTATITASAGGETRTATLKIQ